VDILTYLRNYEPQELVHVSGDTYCTKEHDSLRISNGRCVMAKQIVNRRSPRCMSLTRASCSLRLGMSLPNGR
jgi:hypothetical protein